MAPLLVPATRRARSRKRSSAASTSRSDAKICATSSSTATSITAADYTPRAIYCRGERATSRGDGRRATQAGGGDARRGDDAAVTHVERLGHGDGRLARGIAQVFDDGARLVGDDGGGLVTQPGQALVGVAPPRRQRRLADELAACVGMQRANLRRRVGG